MFALLPTVVALAFGGSNGTTTEKSVNINADGTAVVTDGVDRSAAAFGRFVASGRCAAEIWFS
jgi:hypothetical protein